MKSLIIIVLVLGICQSGFGQAYTGSAFLDEYTELSNYSSLMIEEQGDLYWNKRFELPFDFEFFDTSYNYLNCDYDGRCYFDDDVEYSIKLLTFGYECDNVWDTTNILSDVRYKFQEENGMNRLIVQFTKNRLSSDPSVAEYDSYVNFQWHFYENGTMEVRFGPSNLYNSPVYVPGEGFYLITPQGNFLTGPEMTLTHPYNENIFIDYGNINSYDTYEITYNEYGPGMRWWPPEGWVIRFENNITSTANGIESQNILFPNPAHNVLYLNSRKNFDKAIIFSIEGDIFMEFTGSRDQIDVSSLPNGIYYILLKNSESNLTSKFVKF